MPDPRLLKEVGNLIGATGSPRQCRVPTTITVGSPRQCRVPTTITVGSPRQCSTRRVQGSAVSLQLIWRRDTALPSPDFGYINSDATGFDVTTVAAREFGISLDKS
jgi:hypothetical protein